MPSTTPPCDFFNTLLIPEFVVGPKPVDVGVCAVPFCTTRKSSITGVVLSFSWNSSIALSGGEPGSQGVRRISSCICQLNLREVV